MKIKRILIVLALSLSAAVTAAAYTDVPSGHWAEEEINKASSCGIMNGREDGSFGLSDKIKRSEFAAMLVRLMKWEESGKSAFSDVSQNSWYFKDVSTLAENGVFSGDLFRPEDYITRREMAVMLVKALGYSGIAEEEENKTFSDVSEDGGYISVAHDLGIINGKSQDVFDPNGSALREEGAAMMMRLYSKRTAPLDEIHGFYAISSWKQRELAAKMDTVSFGWSRLTYTSDGQVFLNQTSSNGNDWCIPNGADDALSFMKSNDTETNLAVTMTDQTAAKEILTNEQHRADAVSQTVKAAEGFGGITIDFEGMKGEELKKGLTSFIKELKAAAGEKRIYVAVHPVLRHSSSYYDAYDCKELSEYADKIILMAHDYAANTLPDNLLNTDYIWTPVSPFDEVYTSLKSITAEVSDKSKIMLGISTANTAAWDITDKKITNPKAIHPSVDTLASRLAQADTEINYSDKYKNPYAFYTADNNQKILIWYEDSRSIKAKIELAKMFGINSVSVWRIGAIPDGSSMQYMDVADALFSEK